MRCSSVLFLSWKSKVLLRLDYLLVSQISGLIHSNPDDFSGVVQKVPPLFGVLYGLGNGCGLNQQPDTVTAKAVFRLQPSHIGTVIVHDALSAFIGIQYSVHGVHDKRIIILGRGIKRIQKVII